MKSEEAIQNLEYAVKAYHESGDSWNESDDEMDEALKIATQALEKQVPKKVSFSGEYLCGNCNVTINDEDCYCFSCGQKLDWEETP